MSAQIIETDQPTCFWYLDIVRLDRVKPRFGESERFETPLFGPFPVGVWASRHGASGQWSAAWIDGVVAHAWDLEEALSDARARAADHLRHHADRLDALSWGHRWL